MYIKIMIHLSPEQARLYAVPLIKLTMGDEIGSKAEAEFNEEYEDSCLYGYFDKDKLIAIGGLGSEISPKKIWLGYLAVHPDYRCRGLGGTVLRFVESLAIQHNYKWLLIETYDNPTFENAIKLYEKFGYVNVGYLADYLNDESDIVYYRKNLEK